MIALIEIPHRRPAKVNWYDSPAVLIHEAESIATEFGDGEIHRHGFDSPVENAAFELSLGWVGWVLIRSFADIEHVRNYNGHQGPRIRAMVDELVAKFDS
jgi:hypothetical protein